MTLKYFIILILAVIGIADTAYIYYKKRKGSKLVCYVGENCDSVIHSQYSEIFGVPVEIIGNFYFIFVVIFILTKRFFNFQIFGLTPWDIFLGITSFGALFSVIFVYIQAVVLKEWCEYCMVAHILNFIIWILLVI
ncbi:MAG: vitamin K epoxide reductase family protein [Parcubacteria group bacterium]|nr:vitamin K epoxide reductase family protein [Parcubacteria group bacterium]